MATDSTSHSTRYGLGTFSVAGCAPFAGIVLANERVLAVSALQSLSRRMGCPLHSPESMLGLLEDWDSNLPALRAVVTSLARREDPEIAKLHALSVPMSTLQVHAPVASRQILMSGANYFKHVVDLIVDQGPGATPGTEGMSTTELRDFAYELMRRRQREGAPYLFGKPVSALIGAFDVVKVPAWAAKPDWELELAVIIGKPARNLAGSEALRCVAGYTIANDITNRDKVWAPQDVKAMGTDWITSKGCPTYLPVGPYMVPAAFVPNPQDLRVTLQLNGETKQDESTADMIFDVARLIEHVSQIVQLLPGDLICTGSPAGNGTHFNRYLQGGDVMECAITGLGAQRTPVELENN